MIETTGNITGVARDFDTGKIILQVRVNEHVLNELNRLMDKDIDICLKIHREKRSTEANAYAWVLMSKIAQALNVDKWEVYLDILKRYSMPASAMIVRPEAVERVKAEFRAVDDLGEITINGGQTGHQLLVYFGSSTYDTAEMTKFIAAIIHEAQQLDIDTRTPDEIERMKQQWGV